MYLNSVTIVGNLTRDPELKALPSGAQVATFGIATNESYTDKEGKKVESVEFHNCIAWAKTGELIAQYMKKGSHLLVQGKLQTRSWDKDGVKMYRTEVVVRNCQFGRKGAGAETPTADDNAGRDVKTEAPEYPTEEVSPDDIPF